MKSKNANEVYTQDEVDLIVSHPPNWANAKRFAKVLGRSTAAIVTIYEMAYSGKWLKEMMARSTKNSLPHKIARAKIKFGIFVGHRPPGGPSEAAVWKEEKTT